MKKISIEIRGHESAHLLSILQEFYSRNLTQLQQDFGTDLMITVVFEWAFKNHQKLFLHANLSKHKPKKIAFSHAEIKSLIQLLFKLKENMFATILQTAYHEHLREKPDKNLDFSRLNVAENS